MEILTLLSNNDSLIIEVKNALGKFTVYPLRTIDEFEDLHTNIPLNLLLIDTASHRLSKIEDLLNRLDDDMVILISPDKPDKFTLENLPGSICECINTQSIRTELPVIVKRVVERQRVKNELNMLKKIVEKRDGSMPARKPVLSKFDGEELSDRDYSPGRKYLHEKVLVNFARMLTAGFDMRELFNHFMDSVMEIARVSKMSVMLRNKEGLYVKTHYGLDPYIADNLRLKKDSALSAWLTRTGRIMHKPVNPADTESIKIKSEMELLQCMYSFPMIHKGKLIGIFNIGNKITEEPFYREELEIIYMFCNYLSVAVKDIDLYNQILYQKEFTRNILSSMTSGVIAIDRDEKVTIFNQQASDILNLNPSEIIGRDLRSLTSPLGDILYETMAMGTSYKRYEVEISSPRIPLGINSYRLVDENQKPIGAGIAFTNLSDSKKLEEQKRRTEKLEAINDLIAKIAHEVRTPLTSIQTYTQLLSEKYGDDEDIQNFFTTTVIQSIRSLDSLIEKLVIFSSKPVFNLSRENVSLVIDEAADYISRNIPEGLKFMKQGADSPVYVNVDRKLLIKAIYYLVFSIVDKAEEGTSITMSVSTNFHDRSAVAITIKYSGRELSDSERQSPLKPILDIDNLGTELNIPISQKIIEGHNGTLEIKSQDENNIFIVKLPLSEISGTEIPIERGQLHG